MKPIHVLWILLNFCGWLGEIRSNQLRQTKCATMTELLRNEHIIACKTNEVIYIYKQSMNFMERYILNDDSECRNTSSSTCFRSVPSDFVEDYTSYFNVSNFCNSKQSCSPRYNEFHTSAGRFSRSCSCCSGNKFNLIKISVHFECLPYGNQISFRKNITEIRAGSLYLTSRKSGRCLLKGKVTSARILERANIKLMVKQKGTLLCTEVSGYFDYNRNLTCLQDAPWFLLEFQTKDAVYGNLWMEFSGNSLELKCGNNLQELLDAIPEFSDVEQPQESVDSGLIPLIVGPVAGVLLLTLIILLLKVRLAKYKAKSDIKVATILGGNEKPGQHNDDAVGSGVVDGETQRISTGFVETYYNTTDALPEIDTYSQIDHIKKIGSDRKGKGEQSGVGNGTSQQDKGRLKDDTKTTQASVVVGELTGDVYASVCKQDSLTDKRIVGPQGDIYTTVSFAGH